MLNCQIQTAFLKRVRTTTTIAMLVIVAGCGGSDFGTPVSVSGKVTLDGQPLAELTVIYHSTDQLPAELRTRRAKTDAEGLYSLSEVYPGNYTILFEQAATVPEDPGMASATQSATETSFATKYSGDNALTASVTDAATEFNFYLESKL